MSKKTPEKHKYNKKHDLEHTVREKLMGLVSDGHSDSDSETEKAWDEWKKEAQDPLEGMCVGWSLMFVEDEDLTREVWATLGEEDSKIKDKKLYQEFGRKLWYRYAHTTTELEEKERIFAKLPRKFNDKDFKLAVDHKKEHSCVHFKKAKTDDELYDALTKEIVKIMEDEKDKKSRHYLKIDNDQHSMAIGFSAFSNNKNRVVMETNCNGIEELWQDDYSKFLKEILKGAFGPEVAGKEFSIERFSKSLEAMKSPSTAVDSPKISIFCEKMKYR